MGEWQSIETAPKDGTLFLVWAPEFEGLPSMFSLCAWSEYAGFCIDELRQATHWMPLPEPPQRRMVECPRCHGNGSEWVWPEDGVPRITLCIACHGEGRIEEEP